MVQVSAGYQHSLFLKSDGSLWGMGSTQFGALGPPTTILPPSTYEPESIQEIESSGVTSVAAGSSTLCIFKKRWKSVGQAEITMVS